MLFDNLFYLRPETEIAQLNCAKFPDMDVLHEQDVFGKRPHDSVAKYVPSCKVTVVE